MHLGCHEENILLVHIQAPNTSLLERSTNCRWQSQAWYVPLHLWETAARTCPFLPVSGCPSARNFSVIPSRMASRVLSDNICSHVAIRLSQLQRPPER